MSYYLFEHQNMNAPVRSNGIRGWFYPTRAGNVKPTVIGVHTAENIPDINPPDHGAEDVAHYFTINGAEHIASAHSVVDSDSTIRLLPDEAVAFHIRNYNTIAWGIEIATQASSWSSVPTKYAEQLMDAAAVECARVAMKFDIPVVFRTKAQIDAGLPGFTGHTQLDPTRRSDPGFTTAQWQYFLNKVEDEILMASFTPAQIERLKQIADADSVDLTGVGGIFHDAWESALATKFMTKDSKPLDVVVKQELAALRTRLENGDSSEDSVARAMVTQLESKVDQLKAALVVAGQG